MSEEQGCWNRPAVLAREGKPVIPKVLGYITREEHRRERELLVLIRSDLPGAEVPGGTVMPGEELESAIRREVEEETGLANLGSLRKLATAAFYAEWRDEWQERNVFHAVARDETPDTWTHVVRGEGEDEGLRVTVAWIPVNRAATLLRWGQGVWLTGLVPLTRRI